MNTSVFIYDSSPIPFLSLLPTKTSPLKPNLSDITIAAAETRETFHRFPPSILPIPIGHDVFYKLYEIP